MRKFIPLLFRVDKSTGDRLCISRLTFGLRYLGVAFIVLSTNEIILSFLRDQNIFGFSTNAEYFNT